MRHRPVVAVVAVIALGAAACDVGGTTPPAPDEATIRIASFDFDESEVTAELYAGALRAAGFDVRHVRRVGPREVVLPALERGLVDVVPEYAGSALEFLGGQATPDERTTHEALRVALGPRGIEALDMAPAQSRNGLVVTSQMATDHSLRTVSDLRPLASGLTLGGPPECPQRDLCLPGFAETYGLDFESFLPLDAGGPITAEAVQRGTVDVGVLFTTDGSLAEHGLVLLEDDRLLQPAENLTPLVRHDAVARFGPEMVEVLDAVSAALSTDALRRLNASVRSGVSPSRAAAVWLAEHGLGPDPG
jgi:osmoprotectant transport system substrate-binding protein